MASRKNATDLFSLILAVRRVVREEFKNPTQESVHCSFVQFEALHYLKEHRMSLASDLARHFRITPPAATFIIEGMAKGGLIKRTFDRKDRRAVQLALTKKGEAFFRKVMKARESVFNKIFSVLTPREKAALAHILAKVAAKKK